MATIKVVSEKDIGKGLIINDSKLDVNVDGVTITIHKDSNNITKNATPETPKLQANVVFGDQTMVLDGLLHSKGSVDLLFRSIANSNHRVVSTGYKKDGAWYGDRPNDGVFAGGGKLFQRENGVTKELPDPTAIVKVDKYFNNNIVELAGDFTSTPLVFKSVFGEDVNKELTGTLVEVNGGQFTQFTLDNYISTSTGDIITQTKDSGTTYTYHFTASNGDTSYSFESPSVENDG